MQTFNTRFAIWLSSLLSWNRQFLKKSQATIQTEVLLSCFYYTYSWMIWHSSVSLSILLTLLSCRERFMQFFSFFWQTIYWSSDFLSRILFSLLKQNEFNSDALSNMVANFFSYFCYCFACKMWKNWQPHLTASPLNSSPFSQIQEQLNSI